MSHNWSCPKHLLGFTPNQYHSTWHLQHFIYQVVAICIILFPLSVVIGDSIGFFPHLGKNPAKVKLFVS